MFSIRFMVVYEWNTDLIEMMDLKHLMSQVAHDLNDGETRHESREADAHEHEEVQWTKHASRSDSEAQQHDLASRGGVVEERMYARGPHDMSTTSNKAQPQGLALCPRCHLAWALEGTPVGPGKDTHVTLGPEQWRGRGWPTPTAQRAKRTCHDARSSEFNTQVFRQTVWQARRSSKIECTFHYHFWVVFRLRNNVDFHVSDHECVNNTPIIVAYERNTLSRVAEDVRMFCIDCRVFVLSKSWSSSQAQSFFMCRRHRLHRVSTPHRTTCLTVLPLGHPVTAGSP